MSEKLETSGCDCAVVPHGRARCGVEATGTGSMQYQRIQSADHIAAVSTNIPIADIATLPFLSQIEIITVFE